MSAKENRRPLGTSAGSGSLEKKAEADCSSQSAHGKPTLSELRALRPGERPNRTRLRHIMNAAAEVTAYRATHSPCPHCRALFWMLNGIAARWTFARADEARIEAVAKALAVLFGAIDDLERLECDDA